MRIRNFRSPLNDSIKDKNNQMMIFNEDEQVREKTTKPVFTDGFFETSMSKTHFVTFSLNNEFLKAISNYSFLK